MEIYNLDGKDPYELPKEMWKDDVDLWPKVTYINAGMYLVFLQARAVEELQKS